MKSLIFNFKLFLFLFYCFHYLNRSIWTIRPCLFIVIGQFRQLKSTKNEDKQRNENKKNKSGWKSQTSNFKHTKVIPTNTQRNSNKKLNKNNFILYNLSRITLKITWTYFIELSRHPYYNIKKDVFFFNAQIKCDIFLANINNIFMNTNVCKSFLTTFSFELTN